MSGKPSSKKVTSPRVETSAERLAKIADARQLFLSSALNMSWQLMVTIIVPVLIGVQLDKHFNSSPSYTLAALFLAVAMAVGVIIKTLNSVNVKQAESNKKGVKSA